MTNILYHGVPTPEVNNNYLNDSVMLLIGNTYARGKLIRCKIDADSNAIGSMSDNPILETHEYPVRFDDGKVRELTENVISDSMYSVCDNECNYYLMMELIVDYRNNYKAITVPDKKVVHRGCSFMRISIVGW